MSEIASPCPSEGSALWPYPNNAVSPRYPPQAGAQQGRAKGRQDAPTIRAGIGRGLWIILAILAAYFSATSRVESADASDILSKADAASIFAATRQQWEARVTRAVSAGAARRTGSPQTGIGMATQTPEGHLLIVRPMYFTGDARPTAIQVSVGYRPPFSNRFTDTLLSEFSEETKRQMHPEYDVEVAGERRPDGFMLLFTIREASR